MSSDDIWFWTCTSSPCQTDTTTGMNTVKLQFIHLNWYMYGIFYQAPTLKTFCVPEPTHLKITASVSEALPTSADG